MYNLFRECECHLMPWIRIRIQTVRIPIPDSRFLGQNILFNQEKTGRNFTHNLVQMTISNAIFEYN